MKILIISGFLGAGKTTFIKELSRQTGKDFCIFENEYAQVDIDKALLSADKNLNVWELTENCICCSGKQDFATSILTIANTIDPEFLIVEPTGVAKLSSIIENIRQIQYEKISLLQPVVIVDGNNILSLSKKYGEIFLDQIQNAGQIIISKQDNFDESEQKETLKIINKLTSQKKVVTKHYTQMEKSWWDSLLTTALSGKKIEVVKSESEDSFESLSLTQVELPSPVHLISLLEMICFGVFGKIYRAKGFLPCAGQWLKFDLVDGIYQISGCEEQEDSRAVFIGNELLRTDLRRLFSRQFSFSNLLKPAVTSASRSFS